MLGLLGVQKATFGSLTCRPGPIRPSLPFNFCEAIRKDMLGLLGVQKVTFGSLGCRPRARSVPHCHGVLVLRQRP